ncbi:MAG: hypothetical protein OES47_15530, partial [Acidobacteriota bacterium]|nr:hypothetical protein [Acidobacteriota bacterium]
MHAAPEQQRSPSENPDAPHAGVSALRARTWLVLVPLHLAAFLVLYFATFRLMRSEILSVTSDIARQALRHEVEELQVTLATREGGEPEHLFEEMIAVHQSLSLRLFDADGEPVPRVPLDLPEERSAIEGFLEQSADERIWLDSSGDGPTSLRVLHKVVAGPECGDCHAEGEVRGAVSMSLDLSEALGNLHGRLLRNLAILILAWAALVAAISSFVGRGVRKAAARFEADLAAAGAGEAADSESDSGLVLDPVSAQLHQSLRQHLRQRREREAEVASRLEHTDRLASMGELAAGLAHEIRNPLAGIQSVLELLREDLESDTN